MAQGPRDEQPAFVRELPFHEGLGVELDLVSVARFACDLLGLDR